MRTRILPTLGLALAIITVLAPVASSEARLRKPAAARRAASVATFVVSGTCSGTISGEVRVDGTGYRLAHDARIYEIGRGLVPAGTAYYDRVVTVTGRRVRNTLIVDNVLVRPPSYSTGGAVSVMDESTPR